MSSNSFNAKKWGILTLLALFGVAIIVCITVIVLIKIDDAVNAQNNTVSPTSKPSAVDTSGRGYNVEEYMAARQRLLTKDQRRALGAKLKLTEQEMKLDSILLGEKKEIMERCRKDRLLYTPALSFFKSKQWMETTKTFKIIRKMPKGAALHVHTSAMTSLEWLVRNVTYRDHVYMCRDKDGLLLLNAFLQPPAKDAGCDWKLVREQRAKSSSNDQFDKQLLEGLSFLTSDPLTTYSGTNKAWDRFQNYFRQVDVIDNAVIMHDYFRQALQEFWEDNVQYIEWRGGLGGLTELDGTKHDDIYGAKLQKAIVKEFVSNHPDFIGAKIIISGLRMRPEKTIAEHVKRAVELREEFPDFVLGYDLVAQEDPYNPLLFYLDALLYPSQNSGPGALPYFFHAGETNWQGTVVDENLLDALLLNSTRIGHAYALAKHPELADLVKSRGIAVEVNPISNQLLGLVQDLRNHAMVPLLADDFPLVVSSDDPATWEALPLTHDFFVAFMDLSGEDMGLRFLKQLARNSIQYSGLNATEKESAMQLWQAKWNRFVTETVAQLDKDPDLVM